MRPDERSANAWRGAASGTFRDIAALRNDYWAESSRRGLRRGIRSHPDVDWRGDAKRMFDGSPFASATAARNSLGVATRVLPTC